MTETRTFPNLTLILRLRRQAQQLLLHHGPVVRGGLLRVEAADLGELGDVDFWWAGLEAQPGLLELVLLFGGEERLLFLLLLLDLDGVGGGCGRGHGVRDGWGDFLACGGHFSLVGGLVGV